MSLSRRPESWLPEAILSFGLLFPGTRFLGFKYPPALFSSTQRLDVLVARCNFALFALLQAKKGLELPPTLLPFTLSSPPLPAYALSPSTSRSTTARTRSRISSTSWELTSFLRKLIRTWVEPME